MSRVIGVFSGKGGVGKTTLVANLGSALTNIFHKNVVVFDGNIHTSHLGLHFGLYEDLPITLREVLNRDTPILQAVYIHPSTGIRIIPAPLNGSGVNLTKNKCCKLVNKVKNSYDIVILDCAPGLGKEVLAPMQAVEEAIVISTPDIAALTDAIKTIEILKKLKKIVRGIVINRYKNKKYELTPQEISSTTNSNILGIIPEDEKIPYSISKGIPVVLSDPYSKSSMAFKKIAASLISEHYEEAGLWERLKNIFHLTRAFQRQPQLEQELKKEVVDIDKMKSELIGDIKEELKQEIMKKVKKRIEERIHET